MSKRIFNIVCGIILVLLGVFAFAGGIIPEYNMGPMNTQATTIMPKFTINSFTLYPIIHTWRFYLLPILFYIVFGSYVVYTSFIPRYKISLAILSITTALGLASSFLFYNKFIKSGVYTNGNGAFALSSKDSFVQFIRSVVPNIVPQYTPASCTMFAHILLVMFVVVSAVLLLLAKPKKRKTKYWAAGILGGIVFLITLLSHLYVYFTLTVVYFFGYLGISPIPYLLISILFSLSTSYGLFRILTVSVLRTKAKDAADTQD